MVALVFLANTSNAVSQIYDVYCIYKYRCDNEEDGDDGDGPSSMVGGFLWQSTSCGTFESVEEFFGGNDTCQTQVCRREIIMLSVSVRMCTHIPNSWLFRSHCPTKQSEIGACESVLLEHAKRCREDHQTPRHGWESLGGLSTKMSLPWSAQLLRLSVITR